MTELVKLIININNIPIVLKSKHGVSPEIRADSFIEILLNTDSATETAKILGISEQTKNRIFKRHFIPIFGPLQGGNQTWSYTLLKSVSYKKCFTCGIIKPYIKFGKDKYTSDGLNKKCKYCRSFDNAVLYKNRKLRIPSWYENEREEIAKFYENCPEGYHVDHIIPLQGKLVSGLHTLSNLQYLSAEENIRKGNKFSPGGEIGETQQT